MEKGRVVDLYKIDPKQILESYCNTHHKKKKLQKSTIDFFTQTLLITDNTLRENHNCTPYLVTVTFPKTPSIAAEWIMAGQWVNQFKENVSKMLFVVGGLVVVEPHKNSTLKSKRGKNTKAARPHFHMVLWIAHPELSPSINLLKSVFLQNQTIAKVSPLPTEQDLIRAAVYVVKEKGNPDVNLMCQHFLGWQASVNVWINQKEVATTLERVFQCFTKEPEAQAFLSREQFMQFPTARKYQEKALLLVEIYAKVFTRNGLAVRGEALYKRIEGTRYSWQYSMPLEQWVASTFKLDMPKAYLEILKQNALWITKMGGTKKMAPRFELFPTLKIMLFVIEFKDCIYELEGATRMPIESVAPQTCSVCYADTLFDQCQPPYNLLGLLYTVINWGREQVERIEQLEQIQGGLGDQQNTLRHKERGHIEEMSPEDVRTYKNDLETLQKNDSRFIEALQTFGGLYHPEIQRKANPAIYILGNPNSFKTSIISIILNKLVGKENIDIISRHKSQFNLAALRKPDGSPFVLLFDDHRWDQSGVHHAELLNLLDGKFVRTEKKYGESTQGELKGTLAFTSNQPIFEGVNDLQVASAIKTRVKEVDFYTPNPRYYAIPSHKEFFQQLEKEAVPFSILSNAVFLACRQRVDLERCLPQSFLQKAPSLLQEDRLAYAGQRHLRLIIERLQKKQRELFS